MSEIQSCGKFTTPSRQVLDQSAVRGSPHHDYRDKLQAAVSHWREKDGSARADELLVRAQGVLGMLNVTPPADPMRDSIFEQLRQLKLDWRGQAQRIDRCHSVRPK